MFNHKDAIKLLTRKIRNKVSLVNFKSFGRTNKFNLKSIKL